MSGAGLWICAPGRSRGRGGGGCRGQGESWKQPLRITLLGHGAGDPASIADGEERLCDRGIGGLAEEWVLDAGTPAEVRSLVIFEVSSHGIVVADGPATKALAVPEPRTVPWPDPEDRLSRE